jgi:hypothetical protein
MSRARDAAKVATAIDSSADSTAVTIDASENATFTGAITGADMYLGDQTGTSRDLYFDSGVVGTNAVRFRNNGIQSASIQSGQDDNIVFTTGGTTTALSLDSSQNATFNGAVRISPTDAANNSFRLSYNNLNGTATFGPNSNGGSTELNIGTSQSGVYSTAVNINSSNNATFNGDVYMNIAGGSNGITFDSGSNFLNDYEIGSWTPTLTPGSGSITVGSSNCRYVRVGKICHAYGYISVSSVSSPSGVTVLSLPLVMSNDGTTGRAAGAMWPNNTTVGELARFLIEAHQNRDEADIYYASGTNAGASNLPSGLKMALEKQVVVDRVEVLEDGRMQVRTATRIVEDGEIISQSFHRKVIDVGDDVSGEDQLVQDVAQNMHTPARVAARAEARNAAGL